MSFGLFCGHFGNFFRFGMLYREKSGNPTENGIAGNSVKARRTSESETDFI
jgi:hypothetical protein